MATVKWLTGMVGPKLSTFSRDELVGFRESPLAAGPSFTESFSDDTPIFYSVSYQMTGAQARIFQVWLKLHKFKTLSPWFDGPIVSDSGVASTQELRFTADGYPQLMSRTISGLCIYSAKLMSRPVENTDYTSDANAATLVAAWNASPNDITVFD